MSQLPKKLDDKTIHILRRGPEAIALRFAAAEWVKACGLKSVSGDDQGPRLREAEKSHRKLLNAAVLFAEAARQRQGESLSLTASSWIGREVALIPWTREAKKWIREHCGKVGHATLLKWWCEKTTVRAPDGRRKTFGPQEASWVEIVDPFEQEMYVERLKNGDY